MTMSRLLMNSVAAMVGLSTCVMGQENSYQGPAGPPGNTWGDPGNWSEGDPPGPTHDVTVTTPNATIQMDYAPPGNYSILSFQPDVAGTLGFAGFNRDLNVLGDASNFGSTNGYSITLGSGQRFTVGSPFVITTNPLVFDPNLVDSACRAFRLSATGGSIGVAGTWGPGQVSATANDESSRIRFYLGHSVPLSEAQIVYPLPGVAGTIDSGVTGQLTGAGRWTLDGVTL